jgi:hypothetical protein
MLEAVFSFSVRPVPRPDNEDKPVRELHMAFQVPYIYDFITKLCRQQAEVIQNYENSNVRGIEEGEIGHRKYDRLKFGGSQAYNCSSE